VQRGKKFCSKSCALSGERNGRYGKPGTMRGKIPWSKGKTKNTHESLATAGQKISKVLKQKFAGGELSNVGENNPMFGRTGDTMTSETISRYRSAAAERIRKGVSGYKTKHMTGKYFSEKMSQEMSYKSSWEYIVMMTLESDVNVEFFWYEPDVYILPDGRKSIPDFLVQTKSGDKIVYEVKPTAIQQMPNVAQKLSMIEQVVLQSGKEYRLIGDIEVNEMKEALLCR